MSKLGWFTSALRHTLALPSTKTSVTDALAHLRAALAARYAIEREIGRGGMAAVYLARDVRHGRNVAIKVLNSELGAVLGVERFLSEIRVTATLQHPNLLPLFDSGEADGALFYVMPFVQGESLRNRLQREKQLPVAEAVHIAQAVANALAYAHRNGVIHRDLKPENILLSEGEPLVADFGIAFAVSRAGGERVTQTGISLGTPHYMSPEQATGDRAVDGRSDIYSLGAVLYEMLTGDPPHTASSAQAVIAKLLTEPLRDVRVLRPSVPTHVGDAVHRALEKLPADRHHTAQEFALALGARGVDVSEPLGVPGSFAHERRLVPLAARKRRLFVTVAAMLALVAVGAAIAAWNREASSDGTRAVSLIIPPPLVNGTALAIGIIAISPDSRTVAYVASPGSQSQVYVRRLAELDARPLPGTGGARELRFSPDGIWLAVTTIDGRLLRVPVDGSAAVTLSDAITTSWGGLEWTEQGLLMGSVPAAANGIARIPSSGAPIAITRPQPAWEHGRPYVAPDGETLLFLDWGPGFTEDDFLAIGSLKTPEYKRTDIGATAILGVVDGWLIYLNNTGGLMAIRLDSRNRRVVGEPIRVAEGLSISGQPEAALSAQGTLIYKHGQSQQRLVFLEPGGAIRATAPAGRMVSIVGGRPNFSPDGRRIALPMATLRGDTVATDIWIMDVASRTFARLTALGNVASPEWSADGRHLVFLTWESHNPTIWLQSVDGGAGPEKLVETPNGTTLRAAHLTADGSALLYCHGTPDRAELLYMPLTGARKPERLEDVGAVRWDCSGRLSPDGRWLAYVARDDEATNVYVRALRGGGGRIRVSPQGGSSPIWSRDGAKLYYRSVQAGTFSSAVSVAHVRVAGDAIAVVRREELVPIAEFSGFDVAPDGRTILTLQQDNSGVQLVVATNWTSQLRARLAASRR